MRYVLLVVAIGLLVLGASAYAATAANSRADHGDRLITAPADGAARFSLAEFQEKLDADLARFAARAQELHQMQLAQARQQQEDEQRRQVAIASYGQWGPDLMEAAGTYGQDPAALYRVMACESKGDPYASNGVNLGLFQFDPGTFAGTPYGGQSIYDGHAQIMAAAWMWSQGRKGEWTCA